MSDPQLIITKELIDKRGLCSEPEILFGPGGATSRGIQGHSFRLLLTTNRAVIIYYFPLQVTI